MAPVSEGKRTAEFLVSEANGYRSRAEVTVAVPANTTLPAGRVMALLTSGGSAGDYVPHDEDGTDNGTRDPRAVLYDNLVNDTGAAVDMTATVIIRDAEVNAAHLTHDAARTTDAHIADDLADLAAFGIIAR